MKTAPPDMNPEGWQKVEQIFHSAAELTGHARVEFLDRACPNGSLREQVERLLFSLDEAGDFLERPESSLLSGAINEAGLEEGKRVGSYRIVRPIGRGGMAVVYLAVRADEEYQQQVAIKLIKRGLDTQFVLQRFRNERQILAGLDHPHIAKLLDGGTTDDKSPYFVMQYVEGRPIDAYCAEHKLTLRDRLRLFRTVCSAVEYAHQRLVIHRDIKPGNILVTAEGRPVLLDFGVAKMLSPGSWSSDTLATAMPQFLTPDYASPEQLRGEPVTTATDVYSLGVVLYELLSGHHPYSSDRSLADLIQWLSEHEPRRPSEMVLGNGDEKLHRQLRGDLDNIVLMALRRDPLRRYVSVAQFSEDIQRFLDGQPVIARNDTLLYRSSKFIKRHRLGMAASLLLALVIVTGIVINLREAAIARQERARAVSERNRAVKRSDELRRLANSFLVEVEEAIADLPGATPARTLVVGKVINHLDELSREMGNDPSFQRELALAYRKAGDIQGQPYKANIGDTAGALKSYRKSVAVFEELSRKQPRNVENKVGLVTGYERIASALSRTADYVAALESQKRALDISEKLVKTDRQNKELQRLLATSCLRMGDSFNYLYDLRAALDQYSRSLEIRRSLWLADRANLKAQRELGESFHRMGGVYFNVGRVLTEYFGDVSEGHKQYQRSLKSYKEMFRVSESLLRKEPSNLGYRRFFADGAAEVGRALDKVGSLGAALEYFQKALAGFQDLSAADPTNVEGRVDLIPVLRDLALTQRKLGNRTDALSNLRKAADLSQAVVARDPSNQEVRLYLYALHWEIANLLADGGDIPKAFSHAQESAKVAASLWKSDLNNPVARSSYWGSRIALAYLLERNGRREDAGASLLQIFDEMDTFRRQKKAAPIDLGVLAGLMLHCHPLELCDSRKAVEYARHAVQLTQSRNPIWLSRLMVAYHANGEQDKAVATAKKGLASLPLVQPETLTSAQLISNIEGVLKLYRAHQ